MERERVRWLVRRVQRTWWLLRRDETRADTIAYLLLNAVGYTAAFLREVAHQASNGRRVGAR